MINCEDDSIHLNELFKHMIKEECLINQSLLEYLGISEVSRHMSPITKSEEIYKILKDRDIITKKCRLKEFLKTVSHLWDAHQTTKNLRNKVENLIKILENDIKIRFSKKEILHIFYNCKNKYILLILVKQNIISIKTIIKNIDMKVNNDWDIVKYFYPEIQNYNKKYLNELMMKNNKYELKQFVEENDQNLDFFYKTRKEGGREPKIIELIKHDKCEEFISLVEHSTINLNTTIKEKGTYFKKDIKNLTPIGYSVLYGSLSVFKYLYIKKTKIDFIDEYNNDIIDYAIQGRNYEIIHLLEDKKEIIERMKIPQNLQKYLEGSIKMHHNEIFDYFICSYYIQLTNEIISFIIISRNYFLLNQLIEMNQIDLKNQTTISNIFLAFCRNGNEDIVKILINQPNIEINSRNEIFP